MKSATWTSTICLFALTLALLPPCMAGSGATMARITPPTFAGPSGGATGPSRIREGWATWYSRESCRREGTGGKAVLMANGKPLRDEAMTCALWVTGSTGLPLRPDGGSVRIGLVNSAGAVVKTVSAAWTDNGPGRVPRSRGVIVDLTPAAFQALGGKLSDGKIRVIVEVE